MAWDQLRYCEYLVGSYGRFLDYRQECCAAGRFQDCVCLRLFFNMLFSAAASAALLILRVRNRRSGQNQRREVCPTARASRVIGRKATPPTVALRDGLACHFADGDVTLVLGGASSELLGGSALGTALSDAANALQRTAVALAAGAGPVPPLGLHTKHTQQHTTKCQCHYKLG